MASPRRSVAANSRARPLDVALLDAARCPRAVLPTIVRDEVASSSGNTEKVADALCCANNLIDRVNDHVDPPREGEPDVNPVAEELRAKVLEARKRLLSRSSLH